MVYISTHQRKVIGEAIHDNFETARQKEEIRRKKERLQIFKNRVERQINFIEKQIDIKEVEEKYLVPEIRNWVETPAVSKIKERVKLWLSLGYPVHIIGPTGCGKTAIALRVAFELGRPTVWINGDESITTTDLIGGYSQVDVETVRDKFIHNVFKDKDILKAEWLDNPLTLACKYGYTLVYNEFSRSKPVANNILLSVFEEGILELPTKFGEERYVKVHPNFKAVFTSNSVEYAGVHRPQDALLDRIVSVYMDFYDEDTETKIVVAHTGIEEKEARNIVRKIRKIRERLPEAEKLGTRACIMISNALKALKSYKDEDFEDVCTDVVSSKIKSSADLQEKCKIIKQ